MPTFANSRDLFEIVDADRSSLGLTMNTESESNQKKPPLTDSPWFWLYIFSTAALIALVVAQPKYRPRQTQLERRFLARQEGGQTIKGSDGGTIVKPTGDNLILRLGPLFLIVGSLLMVAWSRLWWSRFIPQKTTPSHEVEALKSSADSAINTSTAESSETVQPTDEEN